MAENKKISELTRVSSLTGAEIVPFAKDGSNGAVTTAKLKEYAQPDLSAINTALGGKVDKVTGKGLSTNDYTDADRTKLGALPTNTQLTQDLASKLNASVWNDAHEQFSIEGSYWSYMNGEVVSDAVWKRTPRIPLNRDAPIILKNVSQSGNAATCFFDEGGNFISAVKGAHGALATIEPSAYPGNAVFVGISTRIEEDTTYSNGDTVEARESAVADAIQAAMTAAVDNTLIAEATAAGAVYNRATGYFELNTLTDITAPQMRAILEWGRYERIYNIANASAYSIVDALPRLRTTIPAVSVNSIKMSYPLFNWTLLGLEIIKFSLNSPTTFTVFNLDSSISLLNQTSLVAILDRLSPVRGGIRIGGIPLTKLSTIFIHELRYDINLANLSALSLASLQYLVTNAANTAPITVTVHPDVYAKLTDEQADATALLPENLLEDILNHSAGVTVIDGGAEFTAGRQYVRFYHSPRLVDKGIGKLTISCDVEGLNEGESITFAIGAANDVPRPQWTISDNGRAVFSFDAAAYINDPTNQNGFLLYDGIGTYTGQGLKLTNFKLSYGAHDTLPYTAPLSSVTDTELREKAEWISLMQIAEARQINFITTA